MSNLPLPFVEAPVIETERLIMRGHRIDDFAASAAMWGDPVVTRHFGRPFTEEEVWTRMLRYVGHWSWMHFGYWALEEKSTGSFIGEVGFADYKREMEPSISGVPEMGWVLAASVHGKGYATEATKAALAWGENHFPSPRTVCIISPENAPSIRVAVKIGYRELLHTTYKGSPTILFER